MDSVSRKVAFAFLFAGAMLTTVLVSRYLTLNPEVYFPEQKETYIEHSTGILCHVVGGMIAMFLGPFQFIAGLRQKRLALHRWLGRAYLGGCALGGLGGLYMAPFAYGGFPAGLGFGMLALLWLVTGTMALVRVKGGNIATHREWMIRSFALTLAAFTLRVYLVVHGVLTGTEIIDLEFAQMYVAVAWICWVPNLIIAECYVNLSRKRQPVDARS